MKKFIKNIVISLLIAIYFFISYSEKEVDISKKQERDGIVYVVGSYRPLKGKLVDRYANGQIKIEYIYDGGELIAVKTYFENGQLKTYAIAGYSGLLHAVEYYDESGNFYKNKDIGNLKYSRFGVILKRIGKVRIAVISYLIISAIYLFTCWHEIRVTF